MSEQPGQPEPFTPPDPPGGPGDPQPATPPDEPPGHEPVPAEPPATPHTGDHAVDTALADLQGLIRQPTSRQVETYVGVHRQLQDRLADLDG